MRSKSMLNTLLLIVLALLSSTATQAQCDLKAYLYADFKTGLLVNTDPTDLIVLSPMTPSSLSDCAGWLEMVVQINIPKNCTAAIIDTDFEGTPGPLPSSFGNWNWVLNIGDSPTNDGWSGDAGTTVHNAELWILNEKLELANAGGAPSLIDSPLVANLVSLTDGAMKFVVKDQFVSWGQPYQYQQSQNLQHLFAIPDTTMPPADQRSIYAGFNRVIFGAPWNGREGCGLRTATIRFQ